MRMQVRARLAPMQTTVKRLDEAVAGEQSMVGRQKKCIELLNNEISNYQAKMKDIHGISLSCKWNPTKNKS